LGVWTPRCGTICRMRRLAGYLLLLLALASFLPGAAFLLFGFAIGLDVRITEPPLLFIGGIVVTVVMFWGARVLLSPEQSHR
jgi:hypothetical protein